jgi:hypothetical protein
MNKETKHWAYEELRKQLEEQTQTWTSPVQDTSEPQVRRVTKCADHELGTVFLMDPQAREEIDEALIEEFYPHIVGIMEGEPLNIPTLEEIQQMISDGREPEAGRVITFRMIDSARPVGSNERPLWSFIFTLQVRLLSYMLSSECLISIPFAAAGPWLLDLLTDARIHELRPDVSADSDGFILNVSSDAGRSYYLDGSWKDPVSALFRGHVRIAECVDRFEREPLNNIWRSQMIEAIVRTYTRTPTVEQL